jgi:hypothetical protein
MPRCVKCARVQPTCEIARRSRACKDVSACARRVRANQETIDERKVA